MGRAPASAVTLLCITYITTSVLQLPCTCGLQSAQQVAKEISFSKRPFTLELIEISLQKSSCIASVNAFRTARHLVACHLVAYGKTTTASHRMIWLHSQNHPIHTISASVPQLSATSTTRHTPFVLSAVTLIYLLCNRDLCIPVNKALSLIKHTMERIWENFNSRCNTTMIASKIGGLTHLSSLPSTIFNLVNSVACLLRSDYCKE